MSPRTQNIDISENRLRNRGHVLDILLSVQNTKQNIIWATDSYMYLGKDYQPKSQIKRELITGINGKLIQPRASKSNEEQKTRTKDKAEVFTPLSIVKEMNMAINQSSNNWPVDINNWLDYISEIRLEITCGEAPFIASRYNPTANTGLIIKTKNRVGFLDHKLQVVNKFSENKKDWFKYAEIALKASYGYEWQGDNLLIARENVLLTMDDFYTVFCKDKLHLKTKQVLSDEQLEYFAKIISWNIWQMDGLKYVKPMSCKQIIIDPKRPPKGQQSLWPIEKAKKTTIECEGCRLNNATKHTGKYAVIKDWKISKRGKNIRFVDIVKTVD